MSSGKYKKLSHVVNKCDYHIVWTPKYRFLVLFGELRSLVENDIRMLCEWKGVEVIELNVQIDHIHMVYSIPPKVSVSELLGTLKGKLAIKIFKSYRNCNRNPIGEIISGQEDILLAQSEWMKKL
jgi:putative transposase